MTLRQKISEFAKNIGFDLVGFSPARIEGKYLKVFEEWLKNGNAADMEYMRKIEQRRDMNKILPGAKSVIVLGMNYFHEQGPLKRGSGRIARYAYGRDYHKVIGKKLKELEKFIHEITVLKSTPTDCTHSVRTKSYVDTGPIMERALAEQAGLGRIGKNGCLITEKFGSWVFLSEIITTISLHPRDLQKVSPVTLFQDKNQPSSLTNSHPAMPSPSRWFSSSQKPFNICGNCTRCMTSCPTGAIIAPGVIDSRLCISYLTIENRKKIPPLLAKIIKKTKRLFGCDICQKICPHNRARSAQKKESSTTSGLQQNSLDGLLTPIAGDSLSIKKLLSKNSLLSSATAFLKAFAGSPLMRAKRKGIKRNAKILL